MMLNRFSKRKSTSFLFGVALLLGTISNAKIQANCPDVGFMPKLLVPTGAKDQDKFQTDDGEEIEMLDVHTFNHFYTFQVDRDADQLNEGISMEIPQGMLRASSQEGFAFRLRATYNSADMINSEMGLRVQLIDEGAFDPKNPEKMDEPTVIADGSSLDSGAGENNVMIDIPRLTAQRTYTLKYNFYQKEILKRGNSLSIEEDTTATGDSIVQCHLPFFTQELILVDRKVVQRRVRKYNQSDRPTEKSIDTGFVCDLSKLDFSREDEDTAEGGLVCQDVTYKFDLDRNHELAKIAEIPFTIAGVANEPITQYFAATMGTEFAVGAGIKMLVRRASGSILDKELNFHPFACSLDKSCQISRPSHKNYQMLNAVLTSGDYVLEFWDLQRTKYKDWLYSDLDLAQLPFYLSLQSYPILQNDVRATCPYMYLPTSFIQEKYVSNQEGQRFYYNDKVIMNLQKLEQRINLKPEADSQLKVVLHESFGVNAAISICQGKADQADFMCYGNKVSQQVGNMEILLANLKKGEQIFVRIDFAHSVVAMHSFKKCPHINIELSMISLGELETMNQIKVDRADDSPAESEKRLSGMFDLMGGAGTEIHLNDDFAGQYQLESHKDKPFEVLSTKHFELKSKKGIFIEIYSSPFQDEVVQLFLKSDTNDVVQDWIETDASDTFDLQSYKSSKLVWAELDAGNYTLEIVAFRYTGEIVSHEYEVVHFQLYMIFDIVDTSREVFLPNTLNYHGLLGYGEETKDFGELIMFWDDLVLYDKFGHHTKFQVQSDMASFTIQLQQKKRNVKLSVFKEVDQQWQEVGSHFKDVARNQITESIHIKRLDANTHYKFILSKGPEDTTLTEQSEIGENYAESISLKIVVSENDEKNMVKGIKKTIKEKLPISIQQVQKQKVTAPGDLKSAFLLGSRKMLAIADVDEKSAFEPKECSIFASYATGSTVVTSIPFEVKELSNEYYVGLTDYSEGSNLLSVAIFEEDSGDEIAVSKQGKYLQQIDMLTLTRGHYYLVVRNDRAEDKSDNDGAPLEFQLDVVEYGKFSKEDWWKAHIQNAVQFCPLPENPQHGLGELGYIHPLSGNTMNTIIPLSVMQLEVNTKMRFEVKEASLLTVYVETDPDFPFAVSVAEGGGMRKSVTLSADQDGQSDNFLHQRGYVDRNVVQVREFLAPGHYWIDIAKTDFEGKNVAMDQKISFCQTYNVGITVSPLTSASEKWIQDVDEETCESPKLMPQKLEFDKVKYDRFRFDPIKTDLSVSYFTTDAKQEGPFLVYFQLDYDVRMEGTIGLVLFKFDSLANEFVEQGLFNVQDGQSTIFRVVQGGTYAISVQNIQSTRAKYLQLGISKDAQANDSFFTSKCFEARYNYLLTSLNAKDKTEAKPSNSFMSAIAGSLMGNPMLEQLQELKKDVDRLETNQDVKDLDAYSTCPHDPLPQSFPDSASGFDKQYSFMFSQNQYDIVDITVEETSLIHVHFNTRNSYNELRVIFYSGEQDANDEQIEPVAYTSTSSQSFHAVVYPSKQASKLKIIYDQADEFDACPVYDLRIAVKPLINLAEENMRCHGYPEPPQNLAISSETEFTLDDEYSFSSEFLDTESENEIYFYYINFEIPHPNYYLDMELRSDFLASNMGLKLFSKSVNTGAFTQIGFAEMANYDTIDVTGLSSQNDLDGQPFTQKLVFIDDADMSDISQTTEFAMQIALKKEWRFILDTLREQNVVKKDDALCFNFGFNIFARDFSNDPGAEQVMTAGNHLVRAVWQPHSDNEMFDRTKTLYAFVEFEYSIVQVLEVMKQNLSYIRLEENGFDRPNEAQHHKIHPKTIDMRPDDDRTIALTFESNQLQAGKCYQFMFDKKFAVEDAYTQGYLGRPDFKVCASRCDCNAIGTEQCIENAKSAGCVCHRHFVGDHCDECAEGYTMNEFGYCVLQSSCESDPEICNGHGTCYQDGDIAKCDCDPGFANDGHSLCGRCADPSLKYPEDCNTLRSWIVQGENYMCNQFPYEMPRWLYKYGTEEVHTIYQQDDGVLQWAGRYNLETQFSMKKKFLGEIDGGRELARERSVHKFFLPGPSIWRLHVNTLGSKAKVSYTIYDHQSTVVASSDGFKEEFEEFDKLNHREGQNPATSREAPYTLMLQYEYELVSGFAHTMTESDCPLMEIHFVVQPIETAQTAIECTASEINSAARYKHIAREVFTESTLLESHLVINSGMDTGSESIINSEDSYFAYSMTDIVIENPGNALTVLVAYQFSNLNIFLTLTREDNDDFVVYDRTEMLNPNNFQNKEIMYPRFKLRQEPDVSETAEAGKNDMVSYIEIPQIDAGTYSLQLAIPKGYWVYTREFQTCLPFDFVIQYHERAAASLQEDVPDEERPYEVVSVYPPYQNYIKFEDHLTLKAKFDRNVDERNMIEHISDSKKICRLHSMVESSHFINANQAVYRDDSVQLDFDFAQEKQRAQNLFKNHKGEQDYNCFYLYCDDKFNVLPISETYMYCIHPDEVEPEEPSTHKKQADPEAPVDPNSVCNPYAYPKLEDNKCVCAHPYTGNDCESCVKGYLPEKRLLENDNKEHTVCYPDQATSEAACNGHGQLLKSGLECECYEHYAGAFCDRCAIEDQLYPDCSGDWSEDLFDAPAIREYVSRKQNHLYNTEGYIENGVESVFQQECASTNYPYFLNSIHDHKEFDTGNFHYADTYMVNHDNDNFIEFTPRQKGYFRMFLKQPELTREQDVSEVFSIEVGIQKGDDSHFYRTYSNHVTDLGEFKDQKLDFTQVFLPIEEDLVNQHLTIYFRAFNYTTEATEEYEKSCQLMYIEMEFRSSNTFHKCDKSSATKLLPQKKIIQMHSYNELEDSVVHYIESESTDVMVHHQDYYIGFDDSKLGSTVTVSLEQKFIDENLIVPIIDVLHTDEEFDSVKNKYKSFNGPICDRCIIGGHKTYNEFVVDAFVPAGTLFRVILMQTVPKGANALTNSERCTSFSFTVQQKPVAKDDNMKALHDQLRCDFTSYLPPSLNTPRYLGEPNSQNQQDFSYLETFRVDHLDKTMQTIFKLHERSLVRFVGVEHKHLQFNLELLKNNHKLIDFQDVSILGVPKSNTQQSVFAVLEPGDYTLKIVFFSEEYVLSEPCNSIQMHMAVMKSTDVYDTVHTDSKAMGAVDLSFANLLKKDNLYKATPKVSNDEKNQFQILMAQSFKFEDKDGQTLLISASSDFLRLDLSFTLVHQDTGFAYQPQLRTESSKKLLIENVSSGEYNLIVYTRSAFQASNFKFEPQYYSLFMELFTQNDKSKKGEIFMKNGDKFNKLTITDTFNTPDQVLCMAKYDQLPESLMSKELSQDLDQNINYSILTKDLVFDNKKRINYTPQEGNDFLRIVADNHVSIAVYKKKEYKVNSNLPPKNVVAKSKQGLLVTSDLDQIPYVIELTFNQLEDSSAKAVKTSCLTGNLQIKAANSSSFKCKTYSKEGDPPLLSLTSQDSEQYLTVYTHSSKAGSLFKSAPKSKEQVGNAYLDLKSAATDLEILVDYSYSLYPAQVNLIKVEDDSGLETAAGKAVDKEEKKEQEHRLDELRSKNRRALGMEAGAQKIHQIDQTGSKHMQKLRFFDLPQGKYEVHVNQPGKPADCHQEVELLIKPSEPLEKLIASSTGNAYGHGKYQSQMEDFAGVRRIPVQLPLNLNSVKLMGGDDFDSKYILFSDLFALNEIEDQNKLMLDVDEPVLMRVYVEDSTLQIKAEKTVGKEEKKIAPRVAFMSEELSKGTYEFKLETFAKKALMRKVHLKQTVQITIMVARMQYIKDHYLDHHMSGIFDCKDSTFPLALDKQTEWNMEENQSFYSYPMLRVQQNKKIKVNTYIPEEVTTYYWRFNETQRFYFEIGSNFVTNHVVMELMVLHQANSWSVMGKQTGNYNTIDVTLPAGDYQLEIHGYMSDLHPCGLYSLLGILNQDSAIAVHQSKNHALMQGDSGCEKKGDSLPPTIYSGPANTRKGNEEMVSHEGNYFRIFEDVLVVRNKNEVLEPWVHEITLEPMKGEGILQVMIQSAVADNMNVYLTNSSGVAQSPLLADQVEANDQTKELSYTFGLRNQKLYLRIEYTGDMYGFDHQVNECSYFNLILNINTLDYLKDELSCASIDPDNTMKTLPDVLPFDIKDKDLDFHVDDIFRVDYPKHFDHYSQKSKTNGDTDHAMVIDTLIETREAFDFKATLAFNLHKSDFVFGLYDYPEDSELNSGDFDPALDIEQLAIMSPAVKQQSTTDVTLSRSLSKKLVVPSETQTRFLFAIQERHSAIMLKKVQDKHPDANLCIAVGLNLSIEKKKEEKALQAPTALRFQYLANDATEAGGLRMGADSVSVVFELNSAVDTHSLKKAAGLILYADNQQVKRFKPTHLETSEKQGNTEVVLTYRINLNKALDGYEQADQLELAFMPEMEEVQTLNGKPFQTSEEFEHQVQTKVMQINIPEYLRNKKEIRAKAQGTSVTNSLKSKNWDPELEGTNTEVERYLGEDVIECLCVHGTCKTGQSTCNKCFDGWKGKLCDVPKKSSKKDMKINKPSSSHQNIPDVQVNEKPHKDQAQQQRHKSQQERIMEDVVEPFIHKVEEDHKSAAHQALANKQHLAKHQGFFSGLLHSIYSWVYWLFESILKLCLLGVALFMLKIGFDIAKDKLALKNNKPRRRRKKAKAEDPQDDGADDEAELFDVELKAINRKHQPMSGNYDDDEESSPFRSRSNSTDGAKLELYQQDEESPVNPTEQKPQVAAPPRNLNNPFDDAVEETTNEIDAALAEDDDWGAFNTSPADQPGSNEFDNFI